MNWASPSEADKSLQACTAQEVKFEADTSSRYSQRGMGQWGEDHAGRKERLSMA